MPKEILYILTCIIGYLLGSVSGAISSASLANGPDLHTVGSKSTGASNVQRTMGWKFGIITFLIDGLKGIIACLIAWLITGSHFASLLAGLFCVIGHNWPVFFHFRGGKGVATAAAAILVLNPIAFLCVIGVFLLTVILSSQRSGTVRSALTPAMSKPATALTPRARSAPGTALRSR